MMEAVFTIWLREVIRFLRSPGRLVGSLGMPFFFLAFLGTGIQSTFGSVGAPAAGAGGGRYLDFMAPGIVGMVLLFSSTISGISVIWDRRFGFLKEMLVAPIPRLAIVLGRTLGGTTTAGLQALIMLVISFFLGVRPPTVGGFLLALVFMALLGVAFVSLGVAIASKMEDPHGFTLVLNFLIMPTFFLSGALFPLERLPPALRAATALNPMSYGVDGLRFALQGQSAMGGPLVDLAVLGAFSALMLAIGAALFRGAEI